MVLGKKSRRRSFAVALILACVAAVLTGTTATATVVWAPCEGAPVTPPRECAVVQVPLDYANPARGTTLLHVARVRASSPNPVERLGTLLVLPGGPPSAGASFVGYNPNLTRSVAPAIQAAYDLVGIEQIGGWDGTPCISGDPLKQYWETNRIPKTSAQLHHVMGQEVGFNQGCTSPSNALVPFMNTARSIRDIETVRQALGIDTYNLLGFSYGTALGHGYAAQYPNRVRRMVLDSVLDRSMPDPVQSTENNMAFDRSWPLFKQWCQADAACSLRGQDLDKLFDNALAVAKTTGMPAPRNPFGGRPLNDWELTLAVEALTASGEATRLWAALVLKDAAAGDGSHAQFIYDLLTGRRLDGSYVGGDGTRRAIGCNDSIWGQLFKKPEDVQEWAQLQTAPFVAPRYGVASVYQGVAQCYGWPLPPVSPQPRWQPVPASVSALLLNADNDASTPLVWAKRVQLQVSGARLVVVTGATHLQLSHSRCAMAHATHYLTTGSLPAEGSRCTYDPDLIPPQLPPDLGMTVMAGNASWQSPEVLATRPIR